MEWMKLSFKYSRAWNKQPRRRHRVKCKLFGDRMTSAWIYWQVNGHRMWVSIDLFFKLNHLSVAERCFEQSQPYNDPILSDWPPEEGNMNFIEWMTFRFYFLRIHVSLFMMFVIQLFVGKNLASHCALARSDRREGGRWISRGKKSCDQFFICSSLNSRCRLKWLCLWWFTSESI